MLGQSQTSDNDPYYEAAMAALHTNGVANKYVWHLPARAEEYSELRAVVYCRVSDKSQKANLKDQEAKIRREAERCGVEVIAVFHEIGRAAVPEGRPKFSAALRLAREAGAVLLLESTNRALRGESYYRDGDEWTVPTRDEWERMLRFADPVPFVAVDDPALPPRDQRGRESARGQREKGRHGGRPSKNVPGYKKQRRIDKLPEVLRMRREGASYGAIARATGLPRTTVADWCRRYR
jgi:DNA invertase Pin-like site-specific DNA recombinase